MANIEFSPEQKLNLTQKLQNYFENELHVELEQFDAEFLLDFIANEMGAQFYNQGLYDAQAILASKLDDLNDAIFEIEKPTS
ncbi:DUF2164 domain-containing protein [Thalassotalea agariperforans]